MRLLSLDMMGVGPFDHAILDFRTTPGDGADVASVTFVTGENGTGKSIVIDTIRAVFGNQYGQSPRSIIRDKDVVAVDAQFFLDGRSQTSRYPDFLRGTSEPLRHGERALHGLPLSIRGTANIPRWVVDYWQSALDSGSFGIRSLARPEHWNFLAHSLEGAHRNADTTQLICHFDYLRDSEDPAEKRNGELLYSAFQAIAVASIPGGRFSHVARSRLEPVFEHRGRQLAIDKLSAGSLYLMQRMLGLLGRMYSCHTLTEDRGDSILDIPGLLLIDEAENHLHPRWQKRLIPTIQTLFPNLQLVVATHSPFILASVRGARVYVCEAVGTGEFCTVTDVTADYADRPVDEILMSPAFAETRPFSQEISDLLDQREEAIQAGDSARQAEIEKKLLAHNPEYFGYLEIPELLDRMTGGAGS